MENNDGVENALENKNYLFSLFCMINSVVSKNATLKLPSYILRSLINNNEYLQIWMMRDQVEA